MRAYRFDAHNSIDDLQLKEEADPTPQRGELLLRVRAVALNFRDVAMVTGSGKRPAKTGLVPTSDGAAEVIAVGEGVDAFRTGDRVIGAYHPRWFGGPMPANVTAHDYGSTQDGWLTELKVVPQEAVVPIPDSLSFEAAATLPCAALTAWNGLAGPNPIGPGGTVLTLGAGGVSIFALQLAKALGARVIATASSAKKGERLRALGADEVVDYATVLEWGARVREITGGAGVDRVIEVGGPATLGESLKAVAQGGEIAMIGYLTKDNPGIDFFAMRGAGASIRPIFNGSRSDLVDLVRVVSAKSVTPVIDRSFGFGEAKAAFAYLKAGGHTGKIVIKESA